MAPDLKLVALEHLGPGLYLEAHEALGHIGPHVAEVLCKEFATVRVQAPAVELLHDIEQEEQVVFVDLFPEQVTAYLLRTRGGEERCTSERSP